MKNLNLLLILLFASLFISACSNSDADESTAENITENSARKGVLVNTITLKPTFFEHFIEVSGVVEADNSVIVSPEVPGTLSKTVVKEGQFVRKGQTLGYLNSSIIDSGIDEVRASLELATTVYDKRKNLWDQNIGSEIEYLQAKTNKESLEKKLKTMQSQKNQAVLSSPISGTVEEIYTKQGELLSPGVPFASVVNLNPVKVHAEVSEAYIPFVKKGDSVMVRFPAIGLEFEKRIDRVGNVINPNNRTFPVEVDLFNKDGFIKLNALCQLRVRDYMKKDALTVPSEIVRQDAKGYYVFKVDGSADKAVAQKTYVKIGKTGVGVTEIVSGLNVSDRIITEGYNEVGDGVSIVLNKSDKY